MITNYHRQQETFSLWRDRWRLHRGEKMLKGKMQQNPSETWDLIFRVVLQRIGAPLLLNYTEKERERDVKEKRTQRKPITAWKPTPVDYECSAHELFSSLFTRLPPFSPPPPCPKRAHTRVTAAFSPSAWSFSKRKKVVSVCVRKFSFFFFSVRICHYIIHNVLLYKVARLRTEE